MLRFARPLDWLREKDVKSLHKENHIEKLLVFLSIFQGNPKCSWAVVRIYILSFLAEVQISLDIPEEVVRKGTQNIHGQ